MNNLQISIELLCFWYEQAQARVKQGLNLRKDGQFVDEYIRSYEMALKTIEQLKPIGNAMAAVQPVESEEK